MNQRLLKGILVILLMSLLPFLILSVFSNPASDDYCYAAEALRLGFFKTQSFQFNFWSGRYFSNAILTLSPVTFGSFIDYKLVALMIIVLTFTSVLAFVSALLNSGASLGEKLVAAAFITALFTNNMPDITEGYYWMPGAVSYQLANVFTLFLFASLIKALKRSLTVRVGLLTLSAVLIVAIVGSSETSMIFLLFSVGAVTAKAILMKDKNRWTWLTLFAVAALCSCIVIFSPGNAVRSSNFPNRHRLFFSIGMSLAQEVRFILSWVSNPALGLGTIIFIPLAANLAAKSELLKNRLYLHPFTSTALLLAFVFLGLFPPYWATGLLGQYRSVNTAYLFFLLGWFINVAVWVSYFKERRADVNVDLPGYVRLIILPLIAVTLLSTNNTRSAFADLIHNRAYRYDRAMRERRSRLEECARNGVVDCQVEEVAELPETVSNPYFVTELSCDKYYWKFRAARDQSQY